MYLIEPTGDYDRLEFEMRLISTNSFQYFVNHNATRNECDVNWTYTIWNVSQSAIKSSVLISGLCPLSFFNASVKTIRDGYDSVVSYILYRNSSLKLVY